MFYLENTLKGILIKGEKKSLALTSTMHWNQAKCCLLIFDFIGVLVNVSQIKFLHSSLETSSSDGFILNAINIVAILR